MASTPLEAHPVVVEDLDQLVDAVRGVDRDGLALLAVADEVHEVHHLARDRVVTREVASGEELAEVEAAGVAGSGGHRARAQVISTGVPSGSCFDSIVIAALSMRTQPCVTSEPSTDASLLPWMPISASPPAKVSSTSEWLDRP